MRILVSRCVLLVCGGFSAAAGAADALDHLNAQEPVRPAYRKPAPDAFQLPPLPPETAPAVTATPATALVRRILFRGNAAVPTAELDALAAPYLGRRLNEADLENLRLSVTRHYVAAGYINSGALLKPGALQGETLTLEIVEGRLRGVRLRGMERLDDGYLSRRLWRDEAEVVNINQLRERFQLALDDPLFKRMNGRLVPGERPGEAWLDVEVERARPYQLSLFANNYRPPSIGANALGISGWVRNLSGYGDALEASLQQGESGDPRINLAWRLPLNSHGTQLSLQYEHGRSAVVEEPMRALEIRSVLDSKDIGLSQTVWENLNHRFSLGLNYVRRENRTTVAGEPFSFIPGEPDGVTRITAWRLWQEYSFRSERQVLALRSTFTEARNNLQDVTGLPPGITVEQADHRYGLWLGQFQFARQVLDNGTQAVLRLSTQQTRDRLLALDRMAIGGVYTVRGYRENQLVRDQGSVLNLEIDYPLLRPAATAGASAALALVPFYDIGSGRNRGETATTLSSVGLALRARWQGFRLDFALAHRLVHPASVTTQGGTLQDQGMHLQLAYDFF